MRQEIELYIGSEKVEFEETPQILYTYQVSDVENPTVIKNSFSKTLTIKGTPKNNRIFGSYWNLERLEGGGGGTESSFNSSKKVTFTLFANSTIYESGYIKLDEVRTEGRDIEYDITLYGGIGSFFYYLKTDDNTGNQKSLYNLNFLSDNDDDREIFDFTINMDTVKEAWDNIDNKDSKWSYINFMPAYNGYPEDFDASKVCVMISGTSLRQYISPDTGKTYNPINGCILGESEDEFTEHQVRDYRSYLMRPVIKMSKIIEACTYQENNGGFDVSLDTDFFNDDNPYWTDTWLTLPMLSKLELSNTNQIMADAKLTGATTTGDTDDYFYQDLDFTIGEWDSSLTNLTVRGYVKTDSAYKYSTYLRFWGKNSDSIKSGKDEYGSLYCQLLAYNGDTIIGASQSYNLTSPVRHHNKLYYGSNSHYTLNSRTSNYYRPCSLNTTVIDSLGYFNRSGFTYETGGAKLFTFKIDNLAMSITGLKMKYYWGYSDAKDKKHKSHRGAFLYNDDEDYGLSSDVATDELSAADVSFEPEFTNFHAIVGDSLGRTGTEIHKKDLLSTENSPCDYLLSYAKMFGLYFSKEADSNTIKIETRKTFFDRTNIVNLEDYIDRGKTMTITPLTFSSKWLQFSPQTEEGMFESKYKLINGREFGSRMVNTGYEFNTESKDIFENICIKGAVEGSEKNKNYTAMVSSKKIIEPWMAGMTFTYYRTNDDGEQQTAETTYTSTTTTFQGINQDYKYYDLYPKVQFCNEDGKGTDGNDVIVFFNGFKDISNSSLELNYILTDDNEYTTALNGSTPCWFYSRYENDSNGKRICYKLTQLPVFERYKTGEDSNTITRSLDYAVPEELYCQGYLQGTGNTIYDTYWQDYIEDMYSVNTKILTCYVRLDSRPNTEWLKRFYWFDNAIWKLNKITDWDITSYDTTKMEFIKVSNLTNYSSSKPIKKATISMVLSKYDVSSSGETISATIRCDGAKWTLSATNGALVSKTSGGLGTETVMIRIPKVTDGKTHSYKITAINDDGVSVSKWVMQNGEGDITVTEVSAYPNRGLGNSGGTVMLNVKSTYMWTTMTPNTYITLSATGGTGGIDSGENVVVTIPENVSPVMRTITISFFDSMGNRAEWKKNQLGVPSMSYKYEQSGGTKTLVLPESGATFSKPEWITITDNGDGTYDVTASNNGGNERENTIIITKGGGTDEIITIPVSQSGSGTTEDTDIFSVYPSIIKFPASGGTDKFSINNNAKHNWQIMPAAPTIDWWSVSPTYGSSLALPTITVTENTGEERTATVQVYDSTAKKIYNIYITQYGTNSDTGATRTLTITPTEKEVALMAGSTSVAITYTNRGDNWVTASSDVAWLTADAVGWDTESGDTGSVVVRWLSNSTLETRTGVITFTTSAGEEATLTIHQAGKLPYLTVSPTEIEFTHFGGTASFTIDTNMDWTIS